MFFKNSLEEQIENVDKKLELLAAEDENLNSDVQSFYEELGVTQEQICQFVENTEHFSSENWEEMQKLRENYEAKLKRDLENIRNPSKSKKSYQERRIGQHWIFVR